MKVLLDECLPRKLRRGLPGHEVTTVPEAGWAGIKNGALLQLAAAAFDAFVTIDSNLPFQQQLSSLDLRIIILNAPDNKLESLEPLLEEVLNVLQVMRPGDFVQVPA